VPFSNGAGLILQLHRLTTSPTFVNYRCFYFYFIEILSALVKAKEKNFYTG